VPETAAADNRQAGEAISAAPRSRKGEQSRARLLEAAREVFERDGFLTARISDIAASAGMAQGSFYHYFDSKEQIFRELAEEQERRLIAPPDEPASVGNGDPFESTIEGNIRVYLGRYRDAARLMGVIEQVSRYDEHVNAARMATQQHYSDQAEQTVRALQAKGLVAESLNPRIAADALTVMVARFAELWLVQGYREYDFDDVVEQLTILCVNALRANRVMPPSNRRRR